MFSILAHSCATLLANCGPLSEMMCSGSPTRLKTWSCSAFAVSKAEKLVVQGIKIPPLVRSWSTTTKIASKELEVGSPVIKSRFIVPNGRSVRGVIAWILVGVGCRIVLLA